MAKAKEDIYEVDGVKVKTSDVTGISKNPGENHDTVHTTKGDFPSTLVPQELVDKFNEE